ncbi:MAG: DNA lyase [Pyrobaculum sp.]
MNCLEATLYPSLTLALLGENYVKKFGVKKGVWAGGDIYLSGRWFTPWRHINDVDRSLLEKIQPLLERYGDCVGISISPGDEDLLFVVAFLTQNTDYHINVLRWARALFQQSEDLSQLAKMAMGGSYQLQKLPHAITHFLELGRPRDRKTLLRIGGVGPKVADLYLLFTGEVTAAPVDKHFTRLAPRFGLAGRPPDGRYCRRYHCGYCPLAGVCLRDLAYRRLGRLAGWVQTVAYLIDKYKY